MADTYGNHAISEYIRKKIKFRMTERIHQSDVEIIEFKSYQCTKKKIWGIMCEKGRARQTKKSLPSLLRQTLFCLPGERSDPGNPRFPGLCPWRANTPKNPTAANSKSDSPQGASDAREAEKPNRRLQFQVRQSAGRLGRPGGHKTTRNPNEYHIQNTDSYPGR